MKLYMWDDGYDSIIEIGVQVQKYWVVKCQQYTTWRNGDGISEKYSSSSLTEEHPKNNGTNWNIILKIKEVGKVSLLE